MTERPDTQHPSDERVAAFLDGRLTTHERALVLTHFAACAECRREMTVAHQVLRSRGSVRRAPTIGLVTALAAVLAFVVVRPAVNDASQPGPAVRAPDRVSQPDHMAGLTVVSPADQALVESAIIFQWRSGGPDATYRVTVQDQSGAVVWDTTLADTAAALPRRVVLARGEYFWSVDAQLADGGSAKAGAHRFTVR
jgi:anti-sigma factor ChrR (cupin superfamily)